MDTRKLIASAAIVLMMYILAVSCTESEETVEGKKVNSSTIAEKKPASSSVAPFAGNEITWRSDVEKVLVIGGIVVCGALLIGAFAWLLSPVLGFKMCNLLGNCEPEAVPYSMHGHGGTLQDLAQPNAYPSLYATPYDSYTGTNYNRKRSLDYLGPIIKTLASAYEKFEQKSAVPPKSE